MTPADRYVQDANGKSWEYRKTSAVLERRQIGSSIWEDVTGWSFLHMTPRELRHVAAVMEAPDDPR